MNSNLTKIDGHNHSGGTGGQIPTSGININADLSFNSLYGPKDLHAITFASIVTPGGSYNKSLFVSDGTGGLTLNELYWKNNAGNAVKITDGNALNVAAFVGGITGDYSAVGADESFDNSPKNYLFKDGSAHWAGLRAGSLVLSEKGTSGSSTITLTVPTGLASTYSVTWPAALPASTKLVQVDNTGAMSFSNTVAGLITASAGVTASANQDITVSGTGRYRHGTFTMQLSPSAARAVTTCTVSLTGPKIQITGGSQIIGYDIPIIQNKRITAIRCYIKDSATGPTKLVAVFCSSAMATQTETQISTSSASAGDGSEQTITLGSLTTTIATGTGYYLLLKVSTGSATVDSNGIEVDYDD